ncbi:MAG: 50S ribosomal protein L22 [Spirochaetaceae bacterium]|jgi:large subunit ribosomal protein L22
MSEKQGYKAVGKYLLVSPFKVRKVADHIRRRPYPEAIALLQNIPNKGARLIMKVVQSAAANALSQNQNLDEDMLFVKELYVNEGPRLKRLWVRGRGRADLLHKRMSHITAVVDELEA